MLWQRLLPQSGREDGKTDYYAMNSYSNYIRLLKMYLLPCDAMVSPLIFSCASGSVSVLMTGYTIFSLEKLSILWSLSKFLPRSFIYHLIVAFMFWWNWFIGKMAKKKKNDRWFKTQKYLLSAHHPPFHSHSHAARKSDDLKLSIW